jgi:hypothetical protein
MQSFGRGLSSEVDFGLSEGATALTLEPATSAPQAAPAITTDAVAAFRDPTRLPKWVAALLWCFAGVAAVAFFSLLARELFLRDVAAGAYGSRASIMVTAQIIDAFVRISGLLRFGLFLLTGFLFLKWVYRSNQNARGMGASDMTFTPGWSVGCYFVPFANLVLPYQAMRELWNATLSTNEWKGRAAPHLVRWWWGLYLLNNTVGAIAGIQAYGTQTIDALIWSGRIIMLAEILAIAGANVAALLVRRLSANQIKRRRVAEVFA